MGKSQEYYDSNPDAKAKKDAYNKEYNKRTIAARVGRNKARRDLGLKKGDPRDASHTSSGVISKHKSKNRGSTSDMPGDKRARGRKYPRKKK
jgi:hypothetical protein